MGLIIVKITKLKKNFFNRNTLHINGSTALDFLQALSDKNLICIVIKNFVFKFIIYSKNKRTEQIRQGIF